MKVWLFLLWLVIVGYVLVFMTYNSETTAFTIKVGGNALYVTAYNSFLMLLSFAIPCLIAAILAELTELAYKKLREKQP